MHFLITTDVSPSNIGEIQFEDGEDEFLQIEAVAQVLLLDERVVSIHLSDPDPHQRVS